MNIVPAREAPAPGAGIQSDRAAAMGLPPDSGPEQRVLLVRPVMARARPIKFLLHMLVLVAAVVGLVYFGLVSDSHRWVAWVSLMVGLTVCGSLLIWKVSTLAAALEVTNKRTIERRGLFSKTTSEVVHDNIRNVQVHQTFAQRVFGVGSLGLSSSGQDGIEIQMEGLRDPDRLRKIIDAYRPL